MAWVAAFMRHRPDEEGSVLADAGPTAGATEATQVSKDGIDSCRNVQA